MSSSARHAGSVPEVVKAIGKVRRRSLSSSVPRLIEKGLGALSVDRRERVLRHDLDFLCGSWTREERVRRIAQVAAYDQSEVVGVILVVLDASGSERLICSASGTPYRS